MTVASELTQAIQRIAQSIDPDRSRTSWYVFGSSALGHSTPSDVDLMVICDGDGTADTVRRAVDADRLAPLPIHLSIFTVAEENEIGAIERREAQRIA